MSLGVLRCSDDPFRKPQHRPARRPSEAGFRIAKATAKQSPSDHPGTVSRLVGDRERRRDRRRMAHSRRSNSRCGRNSPRAGSRIGSATTLRRRDVNSARFRRTVAPFHCGQVLCSTSVARMPAAASTRYRPNRRSQVRRARRGRRRPVASGPGHDLRAEQSALRELDEADGPRAPGVAAGAVLEQVVDARQPPAARQQGRVDRIGGGRARRRGACGRREQHRGPSVGDHARIPSLQDDGTDQPPRPKRQGAPGRQRGWSAPSRALESSTDGCCTRRRLRAFVPIPRG